MKTKTLQIKVPESWLAQYDKPEAFVMVFEAWLEAEAPCETCNGAGFILNKNPLDPDVAEVGCDDCGCRVWESPI